MFRINLPGSEKHKKILLVILIIIVLGVLFNYMKEHKTEKNENIKPNIETTIS
ncbi:MAG: hypothetical protein ACRC28_06105 [Clostridium sp.]|uniref:hypothetical protein n=1 Tax=Clostridium sp. TaxID=1506 RepID=UPI003F2CA62C